MKYDKAKYDALAEIGLLRAIPRDGMTLYNYTAKCANNRLWTPETLKARGLVLESDGTVVACPLPKFFNLGEMPETCVENLPDEMPDLFMKYDGSLIITFHDGRRWRAITRGSWDSEQAQWAQRWLDANSGWDNKSMTFLWELIAPWNRIVVPYAKEQMILLAAVDSHTGEEWHPIDVRTWADTCGHDSALSYGPLDIRKIPLDGRRDGEGYVARYTGGLRVKLKFKHYLALHRIITGMSPRRVWESLAAGEPWAWDESLRRDLPPEFHAWADQVRGELRERYEHLAEVVKRAISATPVFHTRKDYAIFWSDEDTWLRACLFKWLDTKPYDDIIWKEIKP